MKIEIQNIKYCENTNFKVDMFKNGVDIVQCNYGIWIENQV